MDINNSSKFEKGDRFLQNPINYFSDEILFQIGESYSKLVFYSYGKKINKDNLIEQDKDNKILNIEIQIPNHALKALSTFHCLIQLKDTAFKSLEDSITSPQLMLMKLKYYQKYNCNILIPILILILIM